MTTERDDYVRGMKQKLGAYLGVGFTPENLDSTFEDCGVVTIDRFKTLMEAFFKSNKLPITFLKKYGPQSSVHTFIWNLYDEVKQMD